jgi:L-rhamnose mutarotase
MNRNNFIMEEVCATMRDGSDKKRVHHTVWKELQSIMKNRTHYSIRMHAERRMVHGELQQIRIA